MLLSFPDSLSGLFFALLGVYLFFASSAINLHFFLGVFLHFITGADRDPRISEGMDITTQEQTFTFETTDTFVTDMDFEMLFQFGSEQTAQLGEVTVEFSNVTIYQKSVM